MAAASSYSLTPMQQHATVLCRISRFPRESTPSLRNIELFITSTKAPSLFTEYAALQRYAYTSTLPTLLSAVLPSLRLRIRHSVRSDHDSLHHEHPRGEALVQRLCEGQQPLTEIGRLRTPTRACGSCTKAHLPR